MTKLSDIFGRKAGDGSDKVIPLSAISLKNAQMRGEGAGQMPPSLGALAEKNESLRSLLSDAGRRIAGLGELNAIFDSLAEPFNEALTSLEQEKALALSLSGRVEEQGRAFEAMEREFHAVETRARLMEGDIERLQLEIETASGHARSVESERQQLAVDVRNLTAELAEQKRQLSEEQIARRSLAESEEAYRTQMDRADKRLLELESELAGYRERVSMLESEKRSLQGTLDEAQAESGRLARRLSEAENSVAAMRGDLGRLELSELEAKAEKHRLVSALEEATQQHQSERRTLTNRIEGLQSRAATAEGLLTEARQTLSARAEEARAFDRKAIDASVARSSAERRVAQLETLQDSSTRKIRDLETSFNALKEESAIATKALQAREIALARAEDKVAELSKRNAQLEADLQLGRTGIDTRILELQSALARERGERCALEGALAGARRESDRLRRQSGEPRGIEAEALLQETAAAASGEHAPAAPPTLAEAAPPEFKRAGS